MPDPTSRLEKYAEVIVRVGANVQPGQTVFTNGNQEGACEIHGLLLGDQIARPEQFEQVILPRIQAILASMSAA